MVEAGAIAHLSALLCAGTSNERESAACALGRLSEDDAAKALLAKAGAIEPLVALLHAETPGEREKAAAALGTLAEDERSRVAIAKAGAIAPLAALLTRDTSGERRQAAKALSCLAEDDGLRVAIVIAGAVNPLMKLMCTQTVTPGEREQARIAFETVMQVAVRESDVNSIATAKVDSNTSPWAAHLVAVQASQAGHAAVY